MALRNYIFHNFNEQYPFKNFSDLFPPSLQGECENSLETVHFFQDSNLNSNKIYQKQVLYVTSFEEYYDLQEYDFTFGCIRDASRCFLPYMASYQKKDLEEKTRENFEHKKLVCTSVSAKHFCDFLNFEQIDVVESTQYNQYVLCICNCYQDLWLAVQAECIPIYFGPFWDDIDAKIFNKTRIFFSQQVSLLIDLMQNISFLKIIFNQPSFTISALDTIQSQEQKIRQQLGKILIKPGYELLSNGQVPLSDNDLRNVFRHTFINNTLNDDNIEYKSSFFMDLYQRKIELDYNPSENGRRLLLLGAFHVNSNYKLEVVKNNLQHFKYPCMDVVICNTSGLDYSETTAALCKQYGYEYKEIENDKYIDFGKYIYMLGQIDYSKYHTIFFTNDSYVLHYPIEAYINYCVRSEANLVAYTDSSERKYHYQSYLFSLKRKAIPKFVSFFLDYYDKIENVQDHHDIILYYEMGLCHIFDKSDCFLKISDVMNNKGTNVYFHNDKLYSILLLLRIMPMTKIKRIIKDKKKEEDKKKKEKEKEKGKNK